MFLEAWYYYLSWNYAITLNGLEIQDCLFPNLGVKINQFDLLRFAVILRFAVNHFAYRGFQYMRFEFQDSKYENFKIYGMSFWDLIKAREYD